MSAPPPPGPLSGVVVVDLTRALAGPHAAMMLGDLGARVLAPAHLRRAADAPPTTADPGTSSELDGTRR